MFRNDSINQSQNHSIANLKSDTCGSIESVCAAIQHLFTSAAAAPSSLPLPKESPNQQIKPHFDAPLCLTQNSARQSLNLDNPLAPLKDLSQIRISDYRRPNHLGWSQFVKKAESQKFDKKMELLEELAGTGVALINLKKGRIESCNDSLCKIMKISRKQLIKFRFENYLHPEFKEGFKKWLKGCLKARKSEKSIADALKENGCVMKLASGKAKFVWMWLTQLPIKDDTQLSQLALFFAVNITSSRSHQEKLSDVAYKFKGIVEHLPAGVLHIRFKASGGEEISANAELEHITGFARSEIQSLDSWLKLLQPNNHLEVRSTGFSQMRDGFGRLLDRWIDGGFWRFFLPTAG